MTFIMFHFYFFIWVLPTRVRLSAIFFSRTSKKDFVAIPNAPVCQIQFSLYFNFPPTTLVQIAVNTTILIELKGINIAATTGASCPITAK